MTAGTAVVILKALLSLAVFFAQRAERKDIEKALTNEIEILHGRRVRAAADARDRVLNGSESPLDHADPNNRDTHRS